jgi:cation diffusion facilitator family transporter
VAGAHYFPQFVFLDNIATLLVAGFIMYAAWEIIKPNLAQLADEAAPLDEINDIKKLALDTSGVKDVHKIRTRVYGSFIYVDMHVLVDGSLSITQGHDIATNVQHNLRLTENIADVLVHIEPFEE